MCSAMAAIELNLLHNVLFLSAAAAGALPSVVPSLVVLSKASSLSLDVRATSLLAKDKRTARLTTA